MITSIQNPKIKLARGLLSSKKERDASGLFILEGVRLAEEALASGVQVDLAFYSSQLSERGMAVIESLQERGIDTEPVNAKLMARISDTDTSQGILLAAHIPDIMPGRVINFALALDQVRDPGNLGTLLRSAAALGAQSVWLTPGCADAFSPKVLRAGMGAHFKLNIKIMDSDEIHAFCKLSTETPLDILMADAGKGNLCWQEDLTRPLCLIVGGEAEGASEAIRKITDRAIQIPMGGSTESFNAAIAGSILMYEIYRQRSTP